MTDLISKNSLCNHLQEELGSPEGNADLMKANRIIVREPFVDAEKVVRCVVCKHRGNNILYDLNGNQFVICWRGGFGIHKKADGYCDCGEIDLLELKKEKDGYVSVPFSWLVKFCTHIDFKEPMSDADREQAWRNKLNQQFNIQVPWKKR